MNHIRQALLNAALRELLDPGTSAPSFAAALTVLEQDKVWMLGALDERAYSLAVDVAPDRLSEIARLFPSQASLLTLKQAALELIAVERKEHEAEHRLLPIRRAHALAELLSKTGGFEQLDAEVLVWLFNEDEFATPRFYLPLAQWCEAHDPVPDRIVELVQAVREDEGDSPILDRLAAWVAPSVQGMMDLAGWEHGRRRCLDPAWREAASRWSAGGEPTDADRELLRESADAEQSANCDAFQRAVAQDRARTVKALVDTVRSVECPPVWRVILTSWVGFVGGAS